MNARSTAGFVRHSRHTVLLSAGLFVVGCASPGTPKPPSLHLPEVVTDLTAERIGETVRLRWTTPNKTTDGLSAKGAMTAQICRRVSQATPVCLPIRRLLLRAGPSEMVDAVPVAPPGATPVVLEYRVEVLNASERSAGLSLPALAPGGAAPPAVVGFQADAARDGVLLRWRPDDATAAVELERSQGSPAANPGKRGAVADPVPKNAAPVRLGATSDATSAPSLADAGGMVDATAARGESYIYTAQRVRRVVLDGHALELRSAVSFPVTVTMQDVFAPRAPTGLEAIAAKTGGVPGIDLSWTPNTEDDLAGYTVYRRTGNQANEVRVTPSLVLQSAFRDVSVAPGTTYAYTVRAVDRSGNESAPSALARETAPLP